MAALLGLALMVTVVAQADEIVDAAAQAGVDPVDLLGAMHSTGMDAREYLVSVGDLPTPKPLPNYPPPIEAVWMRLAQCESRSIWSINTGNGYYGGLQEDMVFWRRYGGPAFAARPDLATPAAQVTVAKRGLAAQGWAAWPACSRLLGLR